MTDRTTPIDSERRLAEIIRRVKIATAERDDVVVDMKEASRARLELLAEELRPVIEDVPTEADQFDFAISNGTEPRFWIDAVAHVNMARDRRTYRFVRDTRLGRVVLEETHDRAIVADAVSRYIGQRLIERQRALEGDMEDVRAFYARRDAEAEAAERGSDAAEAPDTEALPAMTAPAPRGSGFVIGLLWFIIGCVAGAGILVAALWDRIAGALY
jgi:hypothetical protein